LPLSGHGALLIVDRRKQLEVGIALPGVIDARRRKPRQLLGDQ
jgi:hypothetical protein